MPFILNRTSNRFTTANLYGEPSGSGSVTAVTGGSGIAVSPSPITGVGSVALGPLTANWNAGAYDILARNSAEQFNVRAYGALGDGQLVWDGVLAAGNDHLTSASNPFVLADVGKLITVAGAGAGGDTLVTTINSYVGPGEVVLGSVNLSGAPVAGALVYWGTDNSAAFNAAVNAASSAQGGQVQIDGGRYMFGSQLNIDSKYGVSLHGIKGIQSGGVIASQLIFTQGAGVCISSQPIGGALHIKNLFVKVENTAFAGSVLKVTDANLFVDDCLFDCYDAVAATIIDLTGSVSGGHQITRCDFRGAAIAITGGQMVMIQGCQFHFQSVMSIKDLFEGVTINQNYFEGLDQGLVHRGIAISQTGAHGLTISENWFGDCNSGVAGQSWISLGNSSGVEISGNFINASMAGCSNVTGLSLFGVCAGLSVHGNEFSLTAPNCVGIDGGGFAHRSVFLGSNANTSTTKVQGFDASDILASFGGSTSTPRWGIGTASFDSGSYVIGGGTSVFSVKGSTVGAAPYGVVQTVVSGADADSQIAGNLDFVTVNNTGGAAEKRVATIQGIVQGATATDRGGKLEFYTKANGGTLTGRAVIDNVGNVGIQTTTPTRTFDLNGTMRNRGIAAPAVSEANSGIIYFDSALNRYRVSMNGGAAVDLVGSAGLTGTGAATKIGYWTSATNLDSVANIYADSVNHRLGIGVPAPSYSVDSNGDLNMAGVLRKGGTTILNSVDTVGTHQAVVVGAGAGQAPYCTSVGHNAFTSTGGISARNTVVGAQALSTSVACADNTAVGYQAGLTNTTGSNNVFIGSTADAAAGGLGNVVAIGYGAVVAANDSMVLGNASMKVGIRTSTPEQAHDINGALALRHTDISLANGLNSDVAAPDTSWIRVVDPTGVFSIGGLTGVSDGRLLYIWNTTAFQMTLVNEDGSSTDVNRITTPTGGDVDCKSATLVYEDATDRWILINYH